MSEGNNTRRSIYDSPVFKFYVRKVLEGGKYAKFVEKRRHVDPVEQWKRQQGLWHRSLHTYARLALLPMALLVLMAIYNRWHMEVEAESGGLMQLQEQQFTEMGTEQFQDYSNKRYNLEWTGRKANMWRTAYAGVHENVQRMKIWKGMYEEINERLNEIRDEKYHLDQVEQKLMELEKAKAEAGEVEAGEAEEAEMKMVKIAQGK